MAAIGDGQPFCDATYFLSCKKTDALFACIDGQYNSSNCGGCGVVTTGEVQCVGSKPSCGNSRTAAQNPLTKKWATCVDTQND